ncbi:hypothetical protein KORDIASMS9_01996 [Kordia sp. SMS9]|uniref:hypothetical protein n=1 Tax=Kordia sp. SMS9 TaxID=2282170 RepID=UPI000E0D7BD7|nr:hypothetical protein [Kordia sp. SMS9]AXG69769.1 hypothetical protein KORDIASMS9_01996 [Kordia sp. SMS9]
MKHSIRTALLIGSGFIQLVLSSFIPVAGGGASMILLISLPSLIGLGFFLGIMYYVFIRKFENEQYPRSYFLGMIFIIVFLTFISYPYK